jgi:hypothetical protein
VLSPTLRDRQIVSLNDISILHGASTMLTRRKTGILVADGLPTAINEVMAARALAETFGWVANRVGV